MRKLLVSTEKAERRVKKAVAPTRRVHESLCTALLRPSDDDAKKMRDRLLSATPQARMSMSAEALLGGSDLSDRLSCVTYAAQLLAAVQLQPVPQPVAAAANAAAAAAASPDDPWLGHAALFHADMGLGEWCDWKALELVRRPDFRTDVAQWADAQVGRPVGAKPPNLMKRAVKQRDLLGVDAPNPTLLCKARLFVTAIFGYEQRESIDAGAALEHLHSKPCLVRDKGAGRFCSLCSAHHSLAGRWSELIKHKPEVTEYSIFNVGGSKPVVLAWCAAAPPPAAALLSTATAGLLSLTPTLPPVRCACSDAVALDALVAVAGVSLEDEQARLLTERLLKAGAEACTAECIAAKLYGLRADGFNRCPTCAQPLGEPDGAGLIAAVDGCEAAGSKRAHRVDFGTAAARRSSARPRHVGP